MGPCLGKSRAHVFGFLPTHGVVPEASLVRHEDYFSQSQIEDEEISLLGAAARTRAWLDMQGPTYRKIVLLRQNAPLMRAWSVAARGTPAASKIYIEKPSSEGLGYLSPVFHGRVRRRLEEP